MGLFSRGRSSYPNPKAEPKQLTVTDAPGVVVAAKTPDQLLFEEFIKDYNPSGDLKFNDVNFRKGAPITCSFGLDEGYKIVNGKMEWGWIRLHHGVDRAHGGTVKFDWGEVNDIVYVPFDANRSYIHEYGDTSYGTLTRLFNDHYQFEVRIAHMNPNQTVRKANEKGPMIQWSYDRLKKGLSFERNWVLGSAGTLGVSTGAHTHTEIKSLDESCEVFDILLFEKFGDKSLKEYTPPQVIDAYQKQVHYADASPDVILRDYAELRKKLKVIFLNKYKCQYVDWDNTIKTRYSSELLFNGM